MSGFEKIRHRVEQLARQRPDQVRRGIDKAARSADQRTGGKYRNKIDRGAAQAKRYLDNLGRGGRHPH
ncbi:MAG: antitoxin [Carbonactinosporaceae bacterium]